MDIGNGTIGCFMSAKADNQTKKTRISNPGLSYPGLSYPGLSYPGPNAPRRKHHIMGTFFSNCQVHSDSQEAVVAASVKILKEPAYVSPSVGGWVGVYPEGTRTDLDKLAKQLSKQLSCGVFTWNVHDDDIFWYSLFENGKLRDEFNSSPDYFEPITKAEANRLRGKPEALVQYCLPGIGYSRIEEVLHPSQTPKSAGIALSSDALASVNALPLLPGKSPATLIEALGKLKQDLAQKFPGKYMSADEQAGDLAELFGIDWNLSSQSYRYIERGEAALDDGKFVLISAEMLSAKNRRPQLWELPMAAEDIKAALDQGADPNEVSKYGQLFFLMAARKGAAEVVQVLLDAGGNPNTVTTKKIEYEYNERGITALMSAVMGGANSETGPDAANSEPQLRTVQILLDAGADVNAKSETGITALSEAQQNLKRFSEGKADRWQSEEVLVEGAARNTKLVEMLRAAGAME